MADFCRACSLELFNEYLGDMDYDSDPESEGFVPEDEWKNYLIGSQLCEGCGPIEIDAEGYCLSPDCRKQWQPGHGIKPDALRIQKDLLSQLPDKIRNMPNVGMVPLLLGDHFLILLHRHPTLGGDDWKDKQALFHVDLKEPDGLSAMSAWLQETLEAYSQINP